MKYISFCEERLLDLHVCISQGAMSSLYIYTLESILIEPIHPGKERKGKWYLKEKNLMELFIIGHLRSIFLISLSVIIPVVMFISREMQDGSSEALSYLYGNCS